MAGDPEKNNKAMELHLENMRKVHERQYPLCILLGYIIHNSIYVYFYQEILGCPVKNSYTYILVHG